MPKLSVHLILLLKFTLAPDLAFFAIGSQIVSACSQVTDVAALNVVQPVGAACSCGAGFLTTLSLGLDGSANLDGTSTLLSILANSASAFVASSLLIFM